MRDLTEVTREYMRDPGLWPHWPILPMKRGSGGDGEHGVIVCNGAKRLPLLVYKADMFAFAGCNVEQVSNLPTEEFSSINALMDAGWLVD